MCDPITMAATSATMSYAGGAMAASSYAAVSSVGVAMVNTASLFNYSSTYGKLAGGLAATAAGVGTAVASGVGAVTTALGGPMKAIGTGLSMFSNVQQTSAELRAAQFQEQQAALAAKDAKNKADDEALAAKRKAMERTKAYIESLSSMNTAMGASGMEISSASYEALAARSLRNFKDDSASIRGMGMSRVLNNLFTSQSQQIAAETARSKKTAILAKGAKSLFDDLNPIRNELTIKDAADIGLSIFDT